MNVRVIGLDLSLTATGVALDRYDTRTIRSKERGTARLIELRNCILGLTEPPLPRVDLVVIEGYSFGSKNSHAHALGELGGVVRVALAERGVPYVDASPSTVKKYATGKGNASKGEVLVAAVRRLGFEGSDDNQADALWLRELGLAHVKPSAAVEMPSTHRAALTVVEWPAGLTVVETAADFLDRTKDIA